MNLPKGEPQLTKDEMQMRDMLKFLDEGWSISSSRARSGVAPTQYAFLRYKYPFFADLCDGFSQSRLKRGFS